MRVEKQTKKQEEPKTVSITLSVNDWNILTSSLMLLAECVGKLGIPVSSVGTVYTNCIVLADKINKEVQ